MAATRAPGAGRPRKPAVIRELEGNRSRTPIPKEIKPGGTPVAPSRLTEAERERWDEVVATIPKPVLTAADVQVIERMSVAWAAYRDLTDRIRRSGPILSGQRGVPMLNPLYRAWSKAAEEMDRAGMQLGLSPIARTKLTAPEEEDEEPLAQLLRFAANDRRKG